MASKLKEEREKAGYSIEDVAEILKIRKQYIVDLEEETFESIPGKVYVDGYIKMYYELLGLDCPKKKTISVKAPKLVKIDNKINTKYIVLVSAGILVAIIALYIFLKSPANDLTENMMYNNENNETTIN
mgnify:CR=1 FL=1